MNKLIDYLRAKEWYDSKIPMILSVFLYFYMLDPAQYDFETFLVRFIAYFVYLAMFLAFSYVINDYSDIEVDQLAGKQKIIMQMQKRTVLASLVAMFVLGNLPIAIVSGFSPIMLTIIAFTYFWGAAYSIRLFRFKEKGIWGIIECSIAQRCLPLLLILMLVKINWASFVAWVLLYFGCGLRYILVHQVIDLENDRVANVKTFVSNGNKYKGGIFLAFGTEIILLLILFARFVKDNLWLLLFAVVYIAMEYVIFTVVQKFMGRQWFFTYDAFPLEDLYNIYMPLLLAVLLCKISSVGFVLLVIFVVYVNKAFRGKMRFITTYFSVKIKGEQHKNDI